MAALVSNLRAAVCATVLAVMVGAAAPAPGPQADDMALGSAKARVTVVEYASASCPHCARFNNNVFPAFKKKYVDTGKVRYVMREFLTQPAEIAAAGFLLARCAGKDKYFPTLDNFFHGLEQMYQTGDARGLINAVAGKAGLTPAQADTCISDAAGQQALNDRARRHAVDDDVHGTPTFRINGKPLPETDHEVNLADLDAAITPLLTRPGRR